MHLAFLTYVSKNVRAAWGRRNRSIDRSCYSLHFRWTFNYAIAICRWHRLNRRQWRNRCLSRESNQRWKESGRESLDVCTYSNVYIQWYSIYAGTLTSRFECTYVSFTNRNWKIENVIVRCNIQKRNINEWNVENKLKKKGDKTNEEILCVTVELPSGDDF